jgi:hypothetical protein
MKFSLKTVATFSTLSILAIAPALIAAEPATALPAGMDGTYIGAGISAGVTSGDGEDGTFGGNVQGRFDIPNVPISARGAVLFNGNTSAIMPILTYDLPISRNANLYAGAGYSFVEKDGAVSPLGTQDAVVLTTGAEAAIARNIVVYGDIKVAPNAYQDTNNAAVSLQLGAGYRF